MRVFGQKRKDNASIGLKCAACQMEFKEGDYTVLVSLGPGDDPVAQEKARQGRPYNAVVVEIHATCGGVME